jgi:hypothetical protein
MLSGGASPRKQTVMIVLFLGVGDVVREFAFYRKEQYFRDFRGSVGLHLAPPPCLPSSFWFWFLKAHRRQEPE